MSISFDRAADYYDRTRGYPPGVQERIGRAMLEAAGATRESRLLELGVGTGRIALPIVRAGYRYTGVDISQAMMERLRAALDTMPGARERVTLVEGDATALPFDAGSFDVVITVHVYHLVSDRARVAGESARVLARPGVLLNGRDEDIDEGRGDMFAAWDDILLDLGWREQERVVGASRLRMAPEWQRLGAAVDEVAGPEWEDALSPAQALDGFAERLWSSLWSIPDAIHAEAVARLRTWAVEHYGADLETPVVRWRRFVIERGLLA